MDAAPVWSDLLTFDAASWRGAVDCIIAGFPCQDLSLAGRRAGLDGKRSGLFFAIADIADACGARYLFLENVAGIASATASVVDEAEGELLERAAARVLGELADRGWNAEWLTLRASDVGASHQRERWFCWAWRVVDAGLQHQHLQQRPERPEPAGTDGGMDHPARHGRHQGRAEPVRQQGRPDAAECGGAVADASSPRCEGRELRRALHGDRGGAQAHGPAEQLCRPFFAPGPADAGWPDILARWPWLAPAIDKTAESVLHGMADGMASGMEFSNRAARLKCCGNGVVPLQAAAAVVVLVHRMMEAA